MSGSLANLKSKFYLTTWFRRIKSRFSKLSGPMARGERFVTLDETYLAQYDEIVVVGDIHGCHDEFEELLEKIHSESSSKDPRRTLKILVGDLVNKGPKSIEVLRSCRDVYPDSIIATRGNHDEIVVSVYEKLMARVPLEDKNSWIKSLPSRYVSYLKLLPFTISMPSLNCVVVHAGLDPSKENPEIETPTSLMTTMRNIIVDKDPASGETSYRCVKSDREGAPWATFWPGPRHVYFGHDARRRLQTDHEFATGLDSGCVYGDQLSAIYIKGPRKGELISVAARRAYDPGSSRD